MGRWLPKQIYQLMLESSSRKISVPLKKLNQKAMMNLSDKIFRIAQNIHNVLSNTRGRPKWSVVVHARTTHLVKICVIFKTFESFKLILILLYTTGYLYKDERSCMISLHDIMLINVLIAKGMYLEV